MEDADPEFLPADPETEVDDDGPHMLVPAGIRPIMTKHRVEVCFTIGILQCKDYHLKASRQ